jgi:glutamate synthase domain-containing protein 3
MRPSRSGATGHAALVIERNAVARCGISMKGIDIVVGGDIGHMSAFMGQAGRSRRLRQCR